jgi:tetratricopeptide (TPR) repeat protein
MHDLVRRHARELALTHDTLSDRAAALARLTSFYAHSARAADDLLYAHRFGPPAPDLLDGCTPIALPDEPAALAWFAEEHQQLLTVQQAAVREQWHELTWHIAHALDTYQYRLGFLQENITTSQLSLAAANALGSVRLRASALRKAGRAYTRADHFALAEHYLQQALQLETQTGYVIGQAHAHHDLQRAYSQHAEHEKALHHATSALELYRTAGNPVGQAHALNAQGRQHARLKQYDDARHCCKSALALHVAHANTSGQISTLETLGFIAHQIGHLPEATRHYSEALVLAQRLGNRYAEADIMENLGNIHADQNDHTTALEAWRTAHQLFAAQHRTRDAQRLGDKLTNDRDGSPGV